MNKNRLAAARLLILSLAFVVFALAQETSADTATDPVCGMTVKKSEAKATFDYKGTTYYFCSGGCQDAFAKDPEKYLQKKEEPPQARPHGRMTGRCPMMAHEHGRMAGSAAGMTCPLHSKDVEIKTEILPDGAAVKFTSQNPETVKKIQEHLEKMKSCYCGGCLPQPDVKK